MSYLPCISEPLDGLRIILGRVLQCKAKFECMPTIQTSWAAPTTDMLDHQHQPCDVGSAARLLLQVWRFKRTAESANLHEPTVVLSHAPSVLNAISSRFVGTKFSDVGGASAPTHGGTVKPSRSIVCWFISSHRHNQNEISSSRPMLRIST